MKKEASLLRELLKLNQKHMDRFAKFKICKSLRQLLLQFLTDIHDSKYPEYDLKITSILNECFGALRTIILHEN